MIKFKKCVIDIETTDLHPTQGRIICIGCKDVDSGRTIVFYDDDEQQMLADFLDYFHKKNFEEIIGYNVFFDIRFIFGRCMKYELETNGFFSSKYTDLMQIMKSVKPMWSMNRPGTLDEWTEFLFGSGKMRMPDSVCELYKQGKISDIMKYNERDVEITCQLWERIVRVLDL